MGYRIILLDGDRAVLEVPDDLESDAVRLFSDWWRRDDGGMAILKAPVQIDDRRTTIPELKESS